MTDFSKFRPMTTEEIFNFILSPDFGPQNKYDILYEDGLAEGASFISLSNRSKLVNGRNLFEIDITLNYSEGDQSIQLYLQDMSYIGISH